LGSTLTLAVIQDDSATVAHVGDTRAYLWRKGRLRQLTEDHSVPGALLKQGKITVQEAYTHPHRHILYRCLGLAPKVDADIRPSFLLQPGDMLLLCSDGLWGMVSPDNRLAPLLASAPDLPTICRRLVDQANEAGGEDNITVLLVRVEGADGKLPAM
jgi:protein phosphatase